MSEQLLQELLSKINSIQQNMATKDELAKTNQELTKIGEAVTRIEHDHGNKISALFDGFTLRGDQIDRLQVHLDERLDAIQTDLSYVVGKVAQHDRNIVRLNKIAK